MQKIICFLCFFATAFCDQTICLNMVVKNESDVIEKCLNSLKCFIDYWVICDTGSTDGTKEIIAKCLQDIPGELHESSGLNIRNQALALAKDKADYTLLIEPYEILEFADDFAWPELNKDGYSFPVRLWADEGPSSHRIALIQNSLDWEWRGAAYASSEAQNLELLNGVMNSCNIEVALRFDTLTALEKAVQKNPENDRYLFYLGQEYFALQQFQPARDCFEKRASMKSQNEEETFLTLDYLGQIKEFLGEPDLALCYYFQANAHRQTRAEPLLRCASMYRAQGNYLFGYLLTKYALSLPYPAQDTLVEEDIYDHKLLIEFANCSLLFGKFEEGLQACNQLLANPNLPKKYVENLISNRDFAKSKVGEKCDSF